MIQPTVDLSYNGGPMSVLHQLIRKRSELLRETAKDAVVGTAIMVLQSLRKETKVHRGKGVKIGRR